MKKGIYEFMTYFPFLKEIIKRDFKKNTTNPCWALRGRCSVLC